MGCKSQPSSRSTKLDAAPAQLSCAIAHKDAVITYYDNETSVDRRSADLKRVYVHCLAYCDILPLKIVSIKLNSIMIDSELS